MAKGMLSRSKSFRSKAWNGGLKEDGIPAPHFVVTDAEPCNDLYNLPHEPGTLRKGSLPGLRTAHGPDTPASIAQMTVRDDKLQKPFHSQAYPASSQPHHVNDIAGTENITIGMALGSPSQNPLPPLPFEAEPNIAFIVDTPPAPCSADVQAAEIEDTMKQKGSWKWFGGFFGKRNASTPASPASAFYQLQPTVPPAPHTGVKTSQPYHRSHHEAGKSRNFRSQRRSQETRRDSPRKLRTQTKEKGVKIKPDMQRAHTAPMFQGERQSPTPPPKDYKVQGDSSKLRTDNGPMMLQVDIPDFTMERYSVMFGNVLQPKQPPLLVRRQAQLEKLKTTVGDEHCLVKPDAQTKTVATWLTLNRLNRKRMMLGFSSHSDGLSHLLRKQSHHFSLFSLQPHLYPTGLHHLSLCTSLRPFNAQQLYLMLALLCGLHLSFPNLQSINRAQLLSRSKVLFNHLPHLQALIDQNGVQTYHLHPRKLAQPMATI